MAESDDPWAFHVRGMVPTPLEGGRDPLSAGDSPAPMHSTPISKVSEQRRHLDRLASDSLSAQWGTSHSDEENGHDGLPDDLPAGTSNGHIKHDGSDGKEVEEVDNDDDDDDDDDDDENFVYPGNRASASSAQVPQDEPFVYPSASGELHILREEAREREQTTVTSVVAEVDEQRTTPVPTLQAPQEQVPAWPIDYAELSSLCSHGSLSALQTFFEGTTASAQEGAGVSPFALANEPNPASGLAPLHYAAREGKIDIIKWLVQEAGAIVELEDREGETALHKAALSGKLPILSFLLCAGADANAKDGDGWTALHNACSRGYLDIVKVLIESAGAELDVKGGRGAWTPLMNASSHGHLPVVRYLTAKQHADPFIRNAAGETAYDVAAATFEIFVCEVLERYESERWAALRFAPMSSNGTASGSDEQQRRSVAGQGPYNPLTLHTTVAIMLHENQRLDTRLSTLAVRAGKPRWSGTQAGRPDKADRRAPGTMPPGPLSLSRSRHIPMRRDDVKLPTRQEPYKARLPNRSAQIAALRRARGEVTTAEDLGSTPTPDSVMSQRVGSESLEDLSHFWLSDWQTDLTHPQVDAEQGWQYSQSFDTPEERWLAVPPPPLTRLLEGRGLGQSMQRAVTEAVMSATSGGSAPVAEAEAISSGWVRRRRWVRVMRRRLDVEFGDTLEAAEQASLNVTDSAIEQGYGRGSSSSLLTSVSVYEAQQTARNNAEALGSETSYLDKSRAMAGNSFNTADQPRDDEEMKKQIARLELAIAELRSHAFTDINSERQKSAEELLKGFTVQLGHLRQAAGLEEESEEEDDDDDEEAEFIYPNSYKDDGQSVITRIGTPSVTTSGIVPPRQRSAPSEAGTSVGATRSADLANAREFRVPTNEVPARPLHNANDFHLREQVLLSTWESDGDVTQCRGCNRKFTFFLRKHHCRRCGRIFCDGCSSHRAHLPPHELVIDPGVPEMMLLESSGPTRICDSCDAERHLPPTLRNARGIEALSTAVDRLDLTHSDESGTSDVSSRASELNECPVCGKILAEVGTSSMQEGHVRSCLDNGGGGSVQGGRYLIYKLAEGPIVGKECQICLEDLCVGMTIARLPCLCYYHRHCIDSWFSRGRTCPVHARSW